MNSRIISPGAAEKAERPEAAGWTRLERGQLARLSEGLGRAALLRHAGIFLAAVATYLLRDAIPVDNRVLWILAVSALLNLLVALAGNRPRLEAPLAFLSPLFGVLGWMVLVHLTGGVHSPFVAGFGLEIVLAALTSGTAGISLACAGVVSGLWLQQAALGLGGTLAELGVQTACLIGTGGVVILLGRRWMRLHDHMATSQSILRERLERLERELNDARTLGEVGTNVARLTHGLKNAIHGLRGFSAMIEECMKEHAEDPAMLDGLRASVDRLEEICRQILSPAAGDGGGTSGCAAPQVLQVIDEAVSEVSRSYPRMRWDRDISASGFVAGIEPRALREILLVLLRNAAEATDGRGSIGLKARRANGTFDIAVRDSGTPLSAAQIERLFRPGYTTKPGGSGYGLFIARRLAEAHGGELSARPESEGMAFRLTLLAREPGARP